MLIKLDNENIGGHLTPLHWQRLKLGSPIVEYTNKVVLTIVADCQSSHHRLVTSAACGSLHNGFGISGKVEEDKSFNKVH